MKYIDADHLKVEIEKHIKEVKDAAKRFTPNLGFFDAKLSGIYDVMAIIDSLQQEQQEKKEVKFVFPKFLYARTTNNKTIDVSYAPQSLDAIEYIRSDSLQQEQPEVFDTVAFQKGVQEGRRLEREDVKSTIQSRIDEILGDAQPYPILRMELQELIKKIEL